MSSFFVSGPAEVHVGSSGTDTLLFQFLGWSRDGIRIQLNGAFDPVMSDVSGSRIPFDMQYMAEDAVITGAINLYNESIYTKIAARIMGGTRGAGAALTVGSLMGLESTNGQYAAGSQGTSQGGAFPLLIYSPYTSVTSMSSGPGGAMPAGYRFPFAYLADTTELELSSKAKVVNMIFHALPAFNQQLYSWTLYTHDVTGRAAIN